MRKFSLEYRHLNWMEVVWDSDLTSKEKIVAAFLSRCMNKDHNVAWPSRSTIAEKTGLSIKSVDRANEGLSRAGFLVKEQGGPGKGSNRYFPAFPKNVETMLGENGEFSGSVTQSLHGVTQSPGGVTQSPDVASQSPPNQVSRIRSDNKGGSKSAFALPKDVDPKVWQDFEEHRREIGKKLTDRARTLNANVLSGRPRSEQQMIVDATIRGGWTGLFPPKWQKDLKPRGGIPDFDDPRRKAGTVL